MRDNINLLELNKKYKYKEICDILKIRKCVGNPKIYQLKELELYCKFEKQGHSFIFTEIYETPLGERITRGKADGCRNNHELYYEHIESIMLYVLHNAKDKRVQCSVPDALKLVNMVNSNYKVARRNIPAASDILDIDKKFIYNFYDKTHKKLKTNFERALRKMRSQALVDFQEVTMICKNVPEEVCFNELGEIILDKKSIKLKKEFRIATGHERELILEVESDILKEMGHKDKQSVYLYGDWNRFKKMVESELKSRGNINYYYDAYDIVINKKGIERKISEDEGIFNKNILNEKIVLNLEKSIIKTSNKHKEIRSFGRMSPSCKLEENPKFKDNNLKLVDLLINDKEDNICIRNDIEDYYKHHISNVCKNSQEFNLEIPF